MTPPAPRDWDPERYQRDAGYVPALGRGVLEWLAPQPGERILDLGCGDGTLTAELQAVGAHVVGVDASPAQIAVCRARGLDAQVMAGEALTFEAAFEAVFSNAALHWMTRPDAVIAAVHRALVPGGRFVAEFGGAGNVAAVLEGILAVLDARGFDGRPVVPWFFPTPEDYTARLHHAGFTVERMEHFARPTDLPGDVIDWLDVFAPHFDALLPGDEIADFHAEVAQRVRQTLYDEVRDTWWVDYVRLRFIAQRD
jgi:SAM-dependent methyltransferase